MASKTNVRNEVAEQLQRWMENEMQFKPQGRYANTPLPTKDVLQE
jgi:hypothetical protein